MKYLTPTPTKLTVRTSLSRYKRWFIDGLCVIDEDAPDFLHEIFRHRLLYRGSRSIEQTAARFETLKALHDMDRYTFDRLMTDVWGPVREFVWLVARYEEHDLSDSAVEALCAILDQFAVRIGIMRHYGVKWV